MKDSTSDFVCLVYKGGTVSELILKNQMFELHSGASVTQSSPTVNYKKASHFIE